MASSSHCMTLFLALALLVQSTAAVASDSALNVLRSTDDISWGQGVLAILAIAVGIFLCIMGYRLFRVAVFICGFIIGGIGVASFIEWVFKNKSWLNTASWIGFFVGGLAVALIVISMYKLSVFAAGATGGVLLAFAIHTTVAYRIYQSDPNVVLVILAVILAIVCGIVAVMIERPAIIIATSFIGAISTVWGVGYFAGKFPNGADLKHYSRNIDGDTIISIPDAWWGYLAGIVVLFILGMYIQFKKTGRGTNHHHNKGFGFGRSHHAVPPSYADAQTPPAHGHHHHGNPISHV